MDKYSADDVIPTDSTAIRGKYPVYPEGNYFGIIYKVVPRWQISRSGKRFCRYWVIALLFKNLTTGYEFEKPVQFWFFPGPILKSGLGRGWNIDLNAMALGLGVTYKEVNGKNILPIAGTPVIINIGIIEVQRTITVSVKPVFGEQFKRVEEENAVVNIMRNKVEYVWNAHDHVKEFPIPDDFDFDKYAEEQQKHRQYDQEKNQINYLNDCLDSGDDLPY